MFRVRGFSVAGFFLLLLAGARNERFLRRVSSYSMLNSNSNSRYTRRGWMHVSCASFVAIQQPRKACAKQPTAANPLQNLIEAQKTLDTLLSNYERATTDCTFADVPRELLESKNKELLLEKAATNALFDKSASIETCKTTNRIVRDYLGVTGKGPLVGIDKRIQSGLKFVDPDFFDDYVSELESFSQSYSKATSLSYTAGIADLDSVNNFSKEDADESKRDENSNLQQTKEAIKEAKRNLDVVIALLEKS
mmetsp:Transcript_31270/g.73654  ORF Transcript_31270/g.73654 Transcript_31270/m.73654 type:complete len:251 (-) Transcript_31270:15-767(-)